MLLLSPTGFVFTGVAQEQLLLGRRMLEVIEAKQAEDEQRHNKDAPKADIGHESRRISDGPGDLRHTETDNEITADKIAAEIMHELGGAIARSDRISPRINMTQEAGYEE